MNLYQIEPNGETVTSDRAEHSRLWLVSWLQRRPDLFARVVTCYEQLKRRPAAWRRRLTRSAAVTLGGAALLLALSVAPVSGRNIKVANGEVEIRDNGKCSLIEAIRNANNTVDGQPHDDCAPGNPNGADTITLPKGGQFILKEAHNTGDYGANGLPWISSAITIEGNDSTIMRLDDAPAFRIVSVGALGKLVVRDVSLLGGAANSPDVVSGGGAIFNQGEVTLYACQLSSNTVSTGGEDKWENHGGAVDNRGKSSIFSSTFSDNVAYYGGAIMNAGDLVIEDSTFTRNKGDSFYGPSGGAIMSNGSLTIVGSHFAENSVTGGRWWYFADGGAISGCGSVTIESSRFINNDSTGGGAISFHQGVMSLSDVEMSSNSASSMYDVDGGAIRTGRNTITTIENSLISGNVALASFPEEYPDLQFGGGISNHGTMTIVGSTITGNTALHASGIYNSGTLTLESSTVAHNTVDGIVSRCWWSQEEPTIIQIERSIVAGNHSGDQVRLEPDAPCVVIAEVDGHNLFGTLGDAGVNFDLGPTDSVPEVGIDKILAPLADNGGPTWTHALVRRSPAIDAAPSTACEGMTDQRGYPRNVDGDGRPSLKECDVGAFEYGALPPATATPTPTVTPRPSPAPTATIEPSATSTVEPSPTPATTPTATPTIEPSATATTEPTQTPTFGPSPTTEPSPTATALPELDWQIVVPFICR